MTATGEAGEGQAMVIEAFDMLSLRYSVGPKFLAPPAPTAAQWQRAAQLALRAPDHGGLRPFRFVIVGDRQRPALAELFVRDAIRRGHAAAEVDKARSRAFNGPGLVALVGRVRDGVAEVPIHEQWLCIGAALMNFLNALHLMGFGAKALSGASVVDPEIRSAFCGDGETLVSWVVAGRPTRAAHPKHVDMAVPLIGDWSPPFRDQAQH
jgi:nitroreductase